MKDTSIPNSRTVESTFMRTIHCSENCEHQVQSNELQEFAAKFSFFEAPISNTNPSLEVDIYEVVDLISGQTFLDQTNHYRMLLRDDWNQAKIYKCSKFDYATFSGTFIKRNDSSLLQRSGYICIDLDHLKDLEEAKLKIIELLPPLLLFVSVSGDGLKIVYSYMIEDADHKEYFNALSEFFQCELKLAVDQSGKDISRACFLPHDPHPYFNIESCVNLDRYFVDMFYHVSEKLTPDIKNDQIISRLITWLNRTDKFEEGSRNRYIMRLAHACNRYGFHEIETIKQLSSFSQPGFSMEEIEAIVKSVYKHKEWHGVVKINSIANDKFNLPRKALKEIDSKIVPPMPTSGWPIEIQELILECSSVYQSPIDFWGTAVLSATALAIGQSSILKGKFENAPVFWSALVGNSGTGKTFPLEFAFAPFNQRDIRSFDKYDEDILAREELKMTQREQKDVTNSLAEPALGQYLLTDTSPEALVKANKKNPRGICLYRDELEGWINDFGRYGKSGEVQNLLSSWTQQPFTVNRTSSRSYKVPNPFIAVIGGIQPGRLSKLAEDGRLVNGFLPRICLAYPDLNEAPYYSTKILPQTYQNMYSIYIDRLLQLPGMRKEIRLTPESHELYEIFYNKNADLSNSTTIDYMRELNAKLNIIVYRIALTLHISNCIMKGEITAEIPAETMQDAIEMAQYFRATQIKMYHNLFADNDLSLNNKQIIRILNEKGAAQNEIAKVLKITQQAVSKSLSKG